MRKLKQSTNHLLKELAEMQLSMTELKVISSEKDAEITKLSMYLRE